MAFPRVSGPTPHTTFLFVLRNQTEPGWPKLVVGKHLGGGWGDRGRPVTPAGPVALCGLWRPA